MTIAQGGSAGTWPTGAGAPTAPWWSTGLAGPTLPLAAAVAAAVLVASGTGSAVVAAVLVGAATADRRAGAAALLAVLATALRFRTAGLDDLAGIQSVLGLAGEVGPPAGAAASWLAAVAVLLAAAPLARAATDARVRLAPALPCGLLAAALVAGPGPDQLGLRLLTSAVGVAVAGAVIVAGGRSTGRISLPWAAVVAGVAAVVLAGWPT